LLLNYKANMAMLLNKQFYANRNKTNNRLDHNLTSLNKVILSVIKEDNDLIEIDLKNSQFAIHAYWMKQEGLCDKYQDVQRYHELCSKGILYEELARTMDATRTESKQTMMELAFSS